MWQVLSEYAGFWAGALGLCVSTTADADKDQAAGSCTQRTVSCAVLSLMFWVAGVPMRWIY